MRYLTDFLFKCPLLVLPLLWLAGCATTVNVDYDETIDFAAVKSFRLEGEPLSEPKDERVNTPFVYQRVVEAVEAGLTARGLRRDDEAPDVVATFQLRVENEVEAAGSSFGFGFGTYRRGTGVGVAYGFPADDVATYQRLYLTVDLLAVTDRKLLWRGSHSRRLADGMTPEKSRKALRELVDEILEEYPPEKGK